MKKVPHCPTHGRPLVMFCPVCRASGSTPAKRRAARKNGKLGGRPRTKDA
jgi:hypothetical protein